MRGERLTINLKCDNPMHALSVRLSTLLDIPGAGLRIARSSVVMGPLLDIFCRVAGSDATLNQFALQQKCAYLLDCCDAVFRACLRAASRANSMSCLRQCIQAGIADHMVCSTVVISVFFDGPLRSIDWRKSR